MRFTPTTTTTDTVVVERRMHSLILIPTEFVKRSYCTCVCVVHVQCTYIYTTHITITAAAVHVIPQHTD